MNSSTAFSIGMIAFAIVMFLFLMGFFLDLEFDLFSRFARSAKRVVAPPKPSSVKVAYKKGFMLPGYGHFKGVMGGTYRAEDVKNQHSLGFHAYESFDKALNHNQEGNGDIEEMEEGYISERQRVLQVIPYKCEDDFCPLLPTHFSHMQNEQLWFLCPVHVVPMKAIHKAARLANAIPFVRKSQPFVVEPLDKLPARFPWLNEHKIVIGRLKGRKKFIPTMVESEVLS
jgi:hypothetical protein